ncbi:MAG: deoxyribodipyrimidine photo-lyase [Candidatus Eremiobacteraeota bacterium]|nr:deoxyribodipyrimidine photo-lyase [Candidatus Eremiobacteraeota bacterium]MBC5827140.1 deoxyribodipyrimidine photo-lyase [Candidatus Eremiobacteraeota bacterium]
MSDSRRTRTVVWLRRDLILADNAALDAAKRRGDVCLAFNLDPVLLASNRIGAPIVQAFFSALKALRADLRCRGSDLALLRGDFSSQLLALARRLGAQAVYYNEDYDPAAIARDRRTSADLTAGGLEVQSFSDHVYFGADRLRNDQGQPYRVFTPYSRKWRALHATAPSAPIASEDRLGERLLPRGAIGETSAVPRPEDFGFGSSERYPACSEQIALAGLERFLQPDGAGERYAELRDLPAVDGTSRLSAQLRAGTIGIRTCIGRAFDAAQRPKGAQIGAWINELIWRDFYQMILRSFPHVDGAPFLDAARHIAWDDDEEALRAWCEGETGYPIVDAAMRQLNQSGWMHNRLRMISASFLTKHLLIDWRKGENHFERHLADADLAQNNGGWQWSASTGTDAVPYFRIFNPVLQSKNVDPDGVFLRAWLPALARVSSKYIHAPWNMSTAVQSESGCRIGVDYPAPIVEHSFARARALAAFGAVLADRSVRPDR